MNTLCWVLSCGLSALLLAGCVQSDTGQVPINEPQDNPEAFDNIIALATKSSLACYSDFLTGRSLGNFKEFNVVDHNDFLSNSIKYSLFSLKKAGSSCSYLYASEYKFTDSQRKLSTVIALGGFENESIDRDIIAAAGNYSVGCIDLFQGESPDENLTRRILALQNGAQDRDQKRSCLMKLTNFLDRAGFRILRLVEGQDRYQEVIFLNGKVYEETLE
jgi:hypothetical protein